MIQYREQEKREWLAEWKSSGQSATSFSKDKPFSASSLHYWNKSMKPLIESSFIEVIPEEADAPCFAKLIYPSGVVLEIHSQVETHYLRGLLE